MMKIAIPYENSQIFQHFGHTTQFKLYTVDAGEVVNTVMKPTLGSGHGALAQFLKNEEVDTVICGGIGGGAKQALADAGIQLFGGVVGDADSAVNALLADNLRYDENVQCSHHDNHEEHCMTGGCGGTCSHAGCGNE